MEWLLVTYSQRSIVNTLTSISLSVIFPDMVHVRGIMPVITAAPVLSTLNMLVKPVLTILSFPFILLTLNLLSFVVNVAILQMISFFAGEMNFGFSSFWTTVLITVIMLAINTIVTDYNLSKYE